MSVMRSSEGFEWVLIRFSASSGLVRFGMTDPLPGGRALTRLWLAQHLSQGRALAQRNLVGLQVVAVHLDAETWRRVQLETAVRIVERPVYKMVVLAQV